MSDVGSPKRTSVVRGEPVDDIKRAKDNFQIHQQAPRNVMVKRLYLALWCDDGGATDHVRTLAMAIEGQLYRSAGANFEKHRTRFKQLQSHLQSNAEIQAAVLRGDITAERLVEMKPDDFTTEAQKQAKKEIQQFEAQKCLAQWGEQKTTDMYLCEGCGERKCVFSETQTRGSDEPMTVFISCTVCGFSWNTHGD
eukprot:NODE_5003_length_712_cov_62.680342_g4840_i0.p1 GENE.NODE_5003_length_712_cov_62.680342_g4840_i0~~NODE_5003_length_712_cov_62.680342_g4840_i0.p1  ORF type:complete len:209 (+),score=71.09 NODE_5003_length_712_cov_62.680342_g4840_i0:44-628(+)